MTRLALVTVMLLAVPAMAPAACDGVDNCLGVYFDQGAWTQTHLETAVGGLFDMYFVLQNCTADTLSSYEFAWRYSPSLETEPLVVGVEMPSGEDTGDSHNIIHGLWFPLPVDGPVVLLKLTLLAFEPVAAAIELGPSVPASLPGRAALSPWYYSDLVPMNFGVPASDDGWTVSGVAQLDCVVPIAFTAWGGVKALFR
jgi:hypothetical protein